MINLMLGDSIELMKDIPDHSIDLILTDPPWGYDNLKQFAVQPINYSLVSETDFQKCLTDMYRVLKNGSHAYFFTSNLRLNTHIPMLESVGFKYHQILVVPTDSMKLGYGWRHAFLPIIFVSKNGTATCNQHNKCNLFHSEKFDALNKPPNVIRSIIQMSSDLDNLILDPFMGSGIIGLMSAQMGRNFIGMEIDPDTFQVAKDRIENARKQEKLVTE